MVRRDSETDDARLHYCTRCCPVSEPIGLKRRSVRCNKTRPQLQVNGLEMDRLSQSRSGRIQLGRSDDYLGEFLAFGVSHLN
jgi:hypothetical protein